MYSSLLHYSEHDPQDGYVDVHYVHAWKSKTISGLLTSFEDVRVGYHNTLLRTFEHSSLNTKVLKYGNTDTTLINPEAPPSKCQEEHCVRRPNETAGLRR